MTTWLIGTHCAGCEVSIFGHLPKIAADHPADGAHPNQLGLDPSHLPLPDALSVVRRPGLTQELNCKLQGAYIHRPLFPAWLVAGRVATYYLQFMQYSTPLGRQRSSSRPPYPLLGSLRSTSSASHASTTVGDPALRHHDCHIWHQSLECQVQQVQLPGGQWP